MSRTDRLSLFQHLTCAATVYRTFLRDIRNRRHEPETVVLRQFIRPGNICFDVGAAEGRYARLMAHLCQPGTVYAFEPGAYNSRVLAATIRLHRLRNVVAVRCALGDREGVSRFVVPVKRRLNFGYSLAHLDAGDQGGRSPGLFEEVQVKTVDGFCAENCVEHVDFIKCDVEGAEYLVFRGAQETIRRHLPVVLCELVTEFMARYGTTPGDVARLFGSFGYSGFVFTGHLEPARRFDRVGNYLFIHPSRQQAG